jgi:uncharacterized protein
VEQTALRRHRRETRFSDRAAGPDALFRGNFCAVRIACPICKRVVEDAPEDYQYRPFCSERCKLVDLGNWLGEKYRISRALQPEDLSDDGIEQN